MVTIICLILITNSHILTSILCEILILNLFTTFLGLNEWIFYDVMRWAEFLFRLLCCNTSHSFLCLYHIRVASNYTRDSDSIRSPLKTTFTAVLVQFNRFSLLQLILLWTSFLCGGKGLMLALLWRSETNWLA
jgi:hypothetical protein